LAHMAGTKFILGGGDGLQAHEFAVAIALLALAFASEVALGIFLLGWSCIILGAWLLFAGRYSDPLLFVDTAHTALTMLTAAGSIALPGHTRMLLHATYHVSIVTLAAMLLGPRKWFSTTVPLLYTLAAYAMLVADRGVRVLDPSLSDVALDMSMEAVDYLCTPWAWCVYNLLGGGKRAVAWPFVAFVAYKSALAMYTYPMNVIPATYDLLNTSRIASTSLQVRLILGGLPALNVLVLYPVVWPRIMAALTHGRSLLGL